MMKCTKCGYVTARNDKFCTNCGGAMEEKTPVREVKKVEYKEKPSNKNNSVILAVVITFFVCLIVGGLLYNHYLKSPTVETIEKVKKEVTITDNGIADAVEKVMDSVVVVENYRSGKLYGTGTGFVYQTDNSYGYILTNQHVVSNSNSVKVVFTNNKEIEATLVGSDEFSDIAVLRVDKKNVISVAEIGSSSKLRVGDTVFAVGAPIDAKTYSWSVTRGIISGKNRKVESSNYIMEVLQTDAAINNGNSGGPLCNANGEVIGITNMKLSSSAIEGMGFAIPIDTATGYADKFIKGEALDRPYMGVSVTDTMSYGWFTVKTGVYIQTVESSSPADKAGLIEGDKILEVNGVEVTDTTHFKYELYKYKVGETIEIKYERNGSSSKTKVTLGSNSKSA